MSSFVLRLSAWLSLAAIAVMTDGPIQLRPESGLPPGMERFGAFAVISCIFCVAYPKRSLSVVIGLIIVAALLEALQPSSLGRHGTLRDFAVKAVGVLAGLALAQVKESWFPSK